MSNLKEISIIAMGAMLTSNNLPDFIAHGKDEDKSISRHEAVAIEAEKYARALIKRFKSTREDK